MQQSRMLGNYVQQLAKEKNLSDSDLRNILNCNEEQLQNFVKGRAYATYQQISLLATKLGVTVKQLLAGDENSYNETVVHCMNKFNDTSKREFILDLIDNYIDIYDSVEKSNCNN